MLRPAKTDDAPALAALVNAAYRGDASRGGWTTEAHLLAGQRTDAEMVREMIASDGRAILMLEVEGQLLACVALERHEEHAYLGMLSVFPARQSGGVGKAVLAYAERWAEKAWGVRRIELTVIEQRRELVAWYGRRGYQATGRYEPFPVGDERIGRPLVEGLRLVCLEKRL